MRTITNFCGWGTLVLIAVVSVGCGETRLPLAPTDPEYLKLVPDTAKVNVYNSVEFVAEGGDGIDYEFHMVLYNKNQDTVTFVSDVGELQKLTPNKVKFTAWRKATKYSYPLVVFLRVKNGRGDTSQLADARIVIYDQ